MLRKANKNKNKKNKKPTHRGKHPRKHQQATANTQGMIKKGKKPTDQSMTHAYEQKKQGTQQGKEENKRTLSSKAASLSGRRTSKPPKDLIY